MLGLITSNKNQMHVSHEPLGSSSVWWDISGEKRSIHDLMCKEGLLRLNKQEVEEMLLGNYLFVSVSGTGGINERITNALGKIPKILFSKMLILIEYPKECEVYITEIEILRKWFWFTRTISIGLAYQNKWNWGENIRLRILARI